MVKLKCWKKIHDGKGGSALTWIKGESAHTSPILDIRKISNEVFEQMMEIYPAKGHSRKVLFPDRKTAVKEGIKYMKSHDKC